MNIAPEPACEIDASIDELRIVDHALAYAERGWPVFPCRSADGRHAKAKSPLVAGGFKAGTIPSKSDVGGRNSLAP